MKSPTTNLPALYLSLAFFAVGVVCVLKIAGII
jgi:hypothetical protein